MFCLMSTRRLTALLVALATLTLGVTACGTSDARQPGRSSETLRVGATGWKEDEAALRVAGLDKTPYQVEWALFTGGDQQMQALRAKALDVGESSEIPPVFASAGSAPNFKVVAVENASTLQQEVIVGKNSPLTGIAQLKGRKVGYVKNTTAQYFLAKLLERNGLKWTDIDAAPLSPTDGAAALSSGAIDALASYGNSIITAHQNGARTIGSGSDILSGNFPWTVTDDAIADPAKRAAIVDLLSRIDKAYAYIRDGHEQEFADEISKGTRQPVPEALTQLRDDERQRPTHIRPTSPEAIASQQAVADTFLALGAIPKKIDVSSIWSDTLNADLQKALAAPAPPR
jgi:sulfonate transport system substrate-binding protein